MMPALVIDIDSLPVELRGQRPGSAWNDGVDTPLPAASQCAKDGTVSDRDLERSDHHREETSTWNRLASSIPGVGPITALAIQGFAPPMESFRRGRDFSAWLGLVPRQHTTGGRPRLGGIPKMGQRDLRRLLFTGAMAVIRHSRRQREIADPWLAGMLARKAMKVVAAALANRTARRVWAVATRKEDYRVHAAA